ncbi:MAG: tRNA (guanosine(46)-N7)-methyltransferase TrmB [Schleiferiaceae bacterium]|jgi:tRNA (guanine-N7-)-methyltransferase
MGKDKLRKFRENEEMHNVVQPTTEEAINGLHLKTHWSKKQFGNNQGIVLELGCGKGEYTVEMARRCPEKNHIGVDIKGARLWRGAKSATEEGLDNVAFLRTRIDFIENCFGENEVEEIWITFPDPQIKYKRAKHRLTHPEYLLKYAKLLKPGGTVNLKCDSEYLHGYTHGIIQMLGLEIEESYHDIYAQIQPNEGILFDVITHYESIWLNQGKAITYLRFKLDGIENALKQWKSNG